MCNGNSHIRCLRHKMQNNAGHTAIAAAVAAVSNKMKANNHMLSQTNANPFASPFMMDRCNVHVYVEKTNP